MTGDRWERDGIPLGEELVRVKITHVEATVLANPDLDPLACDSAQDAVVVRISTDEGLVGVGEVDATPAVVRAFLEAPSAHSFSLGMYDMLVGEDPRETRRLWHKLYESTIMAGRRGMGIHALGAIDVALWDLRGKAAGQPVWKLLGGAFRKHVVPYASILPSGPPGATAHRSARELIEGARAAGFRAAKIEAVREVTLGDDDVVEMVRLARETIGPDIVLMVDVGYRWHDAKSALRTLVQLEELDPYFVETPVHVDLLRASAELARATPIRIACGELNATRFEFVELMDAGGVDVVQPDVPRCGGFTEAIRIAEAAYDRGRLVVPHAWNTGITAAAAIHFSAAVPNCPYVEYLPPALLPPGLRRDLLLREPAVVDGLIALPEEPGLGIELDEEAVGRYAVANLVAR
jgi:L-alanine-DL-glutamate epimerase-like enolase superfamily enzyme